MLITGMHNTELIKWDKSLKNDLLRVCNGTRQDYLSGRLPYPFMSNDADGWFEMVKKREDKTALYRAIVYDGEVVGNIIVEQHEAAFAKDAELGYILMPEYESKGVMTEAVGQMCQMAFDRLDLLRLTAMVFSPHTASIRVLEKNEFVKEGCLKNAVYKNGNVYDLLYYGKVKNTY